MTATLVLDTDHMSLLEWGSEEAAPLRERLADCEEGDVATTIVSYEEQMRGWMAYLARARSLDKQVEAYRRLRSHLDNYRQIPVLDFDDQAAGIYLELRRARIRIGTMDLKIAAIVMSRDATLLSRNRRDFAKVPGLKVEDWTV
jgi:tRNA(fMet)-specific endonuclease VapC